jgi:hypothetical protein
MDVQTPDGAGVVWGRNEAGTKILVFLRTAKIIHGSKGPRSVRTDFYPLADLERLETNGRKK